MYSKQLLKGNLQTILLQLLAQNGQMYGYEITQEVKKQSEGKILLTEGALYPTLHKLEADGLLLTERVMLGKRLRKYYRLTPAGNTALANKIKEFYAFMEAMQLIIGGKTDKT